MFNLKWGKQQFIVISSFIFSIISVIVLPGSISTAISLLSITLIILIGYDVSEKHRGMKASQSILFVPILLSVIQNIYLGLASNKLNSTSLQILLSLHFFLFSGLVLLRLKYIIKYEKTIIVVLLILLLQSVLLLIVYPTTVVSAISSLRNILSCILLYCFGLIMSSKDSSKLFKSIIIISWFVVIFGLVERFVGLRIWQSLGITRLWYLKGISTNTVGVPLNWFSSEIIRGSNLRRMVSSFADPVNLGSFLFASFVISWYRRNKVLTSFLLVCAVLTISKGALLGFLIFIMVYFWESKRNRIIIPIVSLLALFIGIRFVNFSLTSSNGSIVVHTMGLLNSFSVLITHPFGLGIGNVGVLAGLFNDSLFNSGVSETGIGMIIAQLGIVGLIAYIVFFTRLFLIPKEWDYTSERDRKLYYTLLLSILANSFFNEVALSPNSCGIYFICLACINVSNTANNDNTIRTTNRLSD